MTIFLVDVNNALLKSEKVQAIGMRTALLGSCLAFKKLKTVIYCRVEAKAKDGLLPFFALVIDRIDCKILIN